MSHLVETMAYAGETPWHGLGVKVPADINPQDLLVKAGLAWDALLRPTYFEGIHGDRAPTGFFASIRSTDGRVLSPSVSKNWKPVQNQQAFDFFMEFCAAGSMKMNTAGSLKNGQWVWALAELQEEFTVIGKKDTVKGYLLFSNPHRAGNAVTVQFTPIRVVCNNTLTMSLEGYDKEEGSGRFKHLHTATFNAEEAKAALGLAKNQLSAFKETAKFLASKKMSEDDAQEFFQALFPSNSDDASPTANKVFELLESQPGAELGAGTWWQGLNAVTYFIDHKIGKSQDVRMQSSWFGYGRGKKQEAVNLALQMAA